MVLDGTAAITGLIVGLLMSPMMDVRFPIVGTIFAIVVAKAPFGGTGRNVFNPAAAGVAFVTFCFPTMLFTYPSINSSTQLPLTMAVAPTAVKTQASLAGQLQAHAVPSIAPMEILLGNFAGPIGATAFLILLTLAVYLMVRRTASPWVILPYYATCTLLAWLFPLSDMSSLQSLLLQLGSGYILFAGVFLINDPVTTPRFWLGRSVYGVLTAGMVMLLQRFGNYEAGTCFAILLMNTCAPIIDRWSWHLWYFLTHTLFRRKEVEA
jgi:electron transport complex protein RnfD